MSPDTMSLGATCSLNADDTDDREAIHWQHRHSRSVRGGCYGEDGRHYSPGVPTGTARTEKQTADPAGQHE